MSVHLSLCLYNHLYVHISIYVCTSSMCSVFLKNRKPLAHPGEWLKNRLTQMENKLPGFCDCTCMCKMSLNKLVSTSENDSLTGNVYLPLASGRVLGKHWCVCISICMSVSMFVSSYILPYVPWGHLGIFLCLSGIHMSVRRIICSYVSGCL